MPSAGLGVTPTPRKSRAKCAGFSSEPQEAHGSCTSSPARHTRRTDYTKKAWLGMRPCRVTVSTRPFGDAVCSLDRRNATQLGQVQELGSYPPLSAAAAASESYTEVPYYGFA